MKITAQILVLPDQPPRVSWTGTREEKVQFCKMEIKERLEYLETHSLVECKAEPWSGVKDRVKADQVRQTAMSLAKAGKFVEAVLQLNTAMRLAPATERDCLGLICAGRSLATWSLGLDQESYQDCLTAISLLPSTATVQRVKLWERMALCRPDKLNHCTQNIRKLRQLVNCLDMTGSLRLTLRHEISTIARGRRCQERVGGERSGGCDAGEVDGGCWSDSQDCQSESW